MTAPPAPTPPDATPERLCPYCGQVHSANYLHDLAVCVLNLRDERDAAQAALARQAPVVAAAKGLLSAGEAALLSGSRVQCGYCRALLGDTGLLHAPGCRWAAFAAAVQAVGAEA